MAIKEIPKIQGPNFGGVIYGLQLTQNFSQSPSILKLNIINKNGEYEKPQLSVRKKVQVSLGGFKFNGFPINYSIKKSSIERTLELEISDNSIILDRYYVSLWKQGFFNQKSVQKEAFRTFDFSDETILVPILETSSGGFSKIRFREKSLGTISLKGSILEVPNGGVRIGNIICLGREMFKDSECDIPSTYYTFQDFRNTVGSLTGLENISRLNISNNYKATYEGTLREVLQSWCSDFGYDFYWDYNSDRVVFYDISNGLSPNISISSNNPSIIEYEESESLEGTFHQFGVAYTAIPKKPVKGIPGSFAFNIVSTINPYSLESFLRKNGSRGKITLTPADESDEGDSGESIYGGDRNRKEFLSAAFLGYINQNLRNLYSLVEPEHWSPMGMQLWGKVVQNKNQVYQELKNSFPDSIERLEKIDDVGLPNIEFALISLDEGQLEKWQTIEQNSLSSLGLFYRHLANSESFFYCNQNSFTEVTCTVDPESQNYEGDNEDFQGVKLFRRDGQISRSADNMIQSLNLKDPENIKALDDLQHLHIELTESLKSVIGGENINKAGILLLYPGKELIKKLLQDFDISIVRSSNPLEKTALEIKNEQEKQQKNNCTAFEKKLENLSCVNAEEKARQILLKRISKETDSDNFPVAGLSNKQSFAAKIKIFGKNETIHAPSDSPYVVVYKYLINTQKLSELDVSEKIYFEGPSSYGVADNILSIDLVMDNATDPEFDNFGRRRKSPFPKPETIINSKPQKKYKIVFAGAPDNLPLDVSSGLSSMDISYSSDGFITTLQYASRPPKRIKRESSLRQVQSQLNRESFNSV
jgi:hypothetical protein